MTTAEAARLLDLPPDSSPEQLETRFLELRAKLEDKIAKAPTPGLKEKYRASLTDITTAFELLTLAADSSDLPVLESSATAKPVGPRAPSPAARSDSPAPATPRAKPKNSGNREFIIVAFIAVILLGGGGWWVMKIRADNAENTRVEADVRATQAEQKVRWEALEKELTSAERKLSELKADNRNTKELSPPDVAELQARFAAQGDYVEWLQPYLSRQPAKTQLAKLDAFLSAKAMDDASSLSTELTQDLTKTEQEVAARKKSLLAITSLVEISSDPSGLRYQGKDAYGRTVQGVTPFTGELPLGAIALTIAGPRQGWVDYDFKKLVKRGETLSVKAEFAYSSAEITSEPTGASVWLGDKLIGVTPLTLSELIPGKLNGQLRLKRHRSYDFSEDVLSKEKVRVSSKLEALLEGEPSEKGEARTLSELGLTLIGIPAGSFTMGDASDGPAHSVTLSRGFWLGKTEVTQGQWDAIMGANPSYFKGANLPVEQVSWDDCMSFCEKLTSRERAAGRLPSGYRYTLPSEAQWEYACRAGTTGDYAGSLVAMAWYEDNSGQTTHAVSGKQANAWGFHDMHGNVWELCSDWYGDYPSSNVTDPTGAASGSYRVNRGGGWVLSASNCRSAKRGRISPGVGFNFLGFRLALSPIP